MESAGCTRNDSPSTRPSPQAEETSLLPSRMSSPRCPSSSKDCAESSSRPISYTIHPLYLDVNVGREVFEENGNISSAASCACALRRAPARCPGPAPWKPTGASEPTPPLWPEMRPATRAQACVLRRSSSLRSIQKNVSHSSSTLGR